MHVLFSLGPRISLPRSEIAHMTFNPNAYLAHVLELCMRRREGRGMRLCIVYSVHVLDPDGLSGFVQYVLLYLGIVWVSA